MESQRKQVGGDHYVRHAIDPFNIIDEYKLDFYEGNVLKYILREKGSDRVQDLLKARHYLDIVIRHVKGLPTRPDAGEAEEGS